MTSGAFPNQTEIHHRADKLVVLFGPSGVGEGTRFYVLAEALTTQAEEVEHGTFVLRGANKAQKIGYAFFKIGGTGYVLLGRKQIGLNGDAKWDCWDNAVGGALYDSLSFKAQSVKQAAALLRTKGDICTHGVILGEGNMGMSNSQIGPKYIFESCADVGAIDYYHIGYTTAEQYAERINGRRVHVRKEHILTAKTAMDSSSYRVRNRDHATFWKRLERFASSADGELRGQIRTYQIAWDSPRESIAMAVLGADCVSKCLYQRSKASLQLYKS